MAHASASIDIAGPPGQVWQLIGGFNSLPNWLPYIPKRAKAAAFGTSRIPTGKRSSSGLRGGTQLQLFYSSGSVPRHGLSVRAVRPSNGWRQGSRVKWSGQFTPKGVSDQEASRLFQSIYEDGLKALAAGFASKRKK